MGASDDARPVEPPDDRAESTDVDGLLWYPAFDDMTPPDGIVPPEEAPGFTEIMGSLAEMPEQVNELARLAKARYQEATEFDVSSQTQTLGSGTDGRPNVGSWVMRLFWHPIDEALSALSSGDRIFGRSALAPSLLCDPSGLRFDPVAECHAVTGRLRVPWSRPALRVRLGIEARSHDRTLFTLTIAPQFRLIYPKGFYRAGHRVLEALDTAIGAHR